MKNKIIVICVILAVLVSLMTFTAVLAQKKADTDKPIETEETTVKENTVTFTWDGEEFTVPKGTTIGEFFEFEEFKAVKDTNDWRIEEGNVLCQNGLDIYCSSELVLVNGASYGVDGSNLIYTSVEVCEETFSIVPGTTWRQYIIAGDQTQQDISIGGDGEGEVVLCHGQMSYVVVSGSDVNIHPDDVIDINVSYTYI